MSAHERQINPHRDLGTRKMKTRYAISIFDLRLVRNVFDYVPQFYDDEWAALCRLRAGIEDSPVRPSLYTARPLVDPFNPRSTRIL